jgi:DNA-binding response OmpR family regulator
MSNTRKILIIEDERDIREMYAYKLRAGGYEVEEAEDGKRGLALLHAGKPDLLLLDIMLPQLDGFDLLQEIRQEKGAAQGTSVIILSNLSNVEDIEEAKRLGAYDYFVKARTTPAEVLERVDRFFKDSQTNGEVV